MPLQKVRKNDLCRVRLPQPGIGGTERQQHLHIVRFCESGLRQSRCRAFELLSLEQRQSNLLVDDVDHSRPKVSHTPQRKLQEVLRRLQWYVRRSARLD